LIRIESGPLHPTHPVLTLCSRCGDSMSRWLARQHKAHRWAPGFVPGLILAALVGGVLIAILLTPALLK
jgi:hypothetical protein